MRFLQQVLNEILPDEPTDKATMKLVVLVVLIACAASGAYLYLS